MKKNMKKKKKEQNGIGLLPNCHVKFFFFFFLYCNLAIVLQEREGWKKNFVLQEKGVVGWFVLQCEEYCKKKGFCIAIQSVYCK